MAEKVSNPAHPFHLLKAIVATHPSMVAACASLFTGLGSTCIMGNVSGPPDDNEKKTDDTFGLVLQALSHGQPISAEELQELKCAAMKVDFGALAKLRDLIEKNGEHRAMAAFVEVIEKGEDPIPEIARTELESAEPNELMKKAVAGDSEALNAVIVMVFVSKNKKAAAALSSYYADLAERAITGARTKRESSNVLALLREVIFKDPEAIPWMGKVAEEGSLEGWEALGEAMNNGAPKIADQAMSTMREIIISNLVDKVRNSLNPNATDVFRTIDILKMLITKVGRLAAIRELEEWPNERAGVLLRDLAGGNHPGAQEAHDRWRQQYGVQTPPTGTEVVVESASRRRRDDEKTLVGMPTHDKPPNPSPAKPKKK